MAMSAQLELSPNEASLLVRTLVAARRQLTEEIDALDMPKGDLLLASTLEAERDRLKQLTYRVAGLLGEFAVKRYATQATLAETWGEHP